MVRREARAVPRGGCPSGDRDGSPLGRGCSLRPLPAPPAPPRPGGGRPRAEPRAGRGPRQGPALPPAAPAAPSLRRLVVLDQQEAEQAQEALWPAEDGGEHQAMPGGVLSAMALYGGGGCPGVPAAGARARRGPGRAVAPSQGLGPGRGPRPARAAAGSSGNTCAPPGTRCRHDHGAREGAEDPGSMKTRTPSRSRFWLLTGPEARRRPPGRSGALRSPRGAGGDP